MDKAGSDSDPYNVVGVCGWLISLDDKPFAGPPQPVSKCLGEAEAFDFSALDGAEEFDEDLPDAGDPQPVSQFLGNWQSSRSRSLMGALSQFLVRQKFRPRRNLDRRRASRLAPFLEGRCRRPRGRRRWSGLGVHVRCVGWRL